MARRAAARTIGQVIPLAALSDWHDVVSVVLLVDASAVNAREPIPCQHRLPPLAVGLVAIPTLCRVRPSALVTPCGGTQPKRPVGWDALWHQLLNITTPVVPVLFVVAETIFRNSVPNTSSGSE
jgi:hypothetical protein